MEMQSPNERSCGRNMELPKAAVSETGVMEPERVSPKAKKGGSRHARLCNKGKDPDLK